MPEKTSDKWSAKTEIKPAKKAKKPTVIKPLTFKTNGWCEKLQTSYLVGKHMPKTKAEYDALLPYSVEGKK
jgi:hypothetical protein